MVLASVVDPAVVFEMVPGTATVAPGAKVGTSGFVEAIAAHIDAFALSHFVAYGVLAWLLAAGIGGAGGDEDGSRRVRRLLFVVALAAAVGLGVELIQAPLAARTASAADAAVNGLGAVAGVGVYKGLRAARGSRQ